MNLSPEFSIILIIYVLMPFQKAIQIRRVTATGKQNIWKDNSKRCFFLGAGQIPAPRKKHRFEDRRVKLETAVLFQNTSTPDASFTWLTAALPGSLGLDMGHVAQNIARVGIKVFQLVSWIGKNRNLVLIKTGLFGRRIAIFGYMLDIIADAEYPQIDALDHQSIFP